MYVNDLKNYLKIDNLKTAILQLKLNSVRKYYSHNRINVNTKNENASHSRVKESQYTTTTLKETQSRGWIRGLGVYLDWKMLLSKAFRNMGFVLRACRPFKDIVAIKSVYFTYVRSVLEYACAIWSHQYNIHISRLERI